MTKHTTHRMHANSLAAHDEAAFSARERMILELLANNYAALTDREVMQRLGFTEPNSVRPRLTSLVQRGVVMECQPVKDAVTGKTVRTVRLAVPVQQVIA